MKTIDIAMIAWPRTAERLGYMEETLASIREKVTASRHRIVMRVSLEMFDVRGDYFTAARRICAKYDAEPRWRAKPASLGGNMNDALMLGHGDFILLTQDDWPWVESVDLSDDADWLERAGDYALIRYATFYTEFDGVLPGSELLNVNMTGPYPYGDQPHLRRADFATCRSVTNGEPVGFYKDPGPYSGEANYATPENSMSEHLTAQGWKIAAYHPNVVSHNGCLSTDPERHPVPA